MSTILRALQKVEKETDDGGQLSSTHPVKTTQTINRRLTTLWYLQVGKRYFIIGSGALALILIVFFALKMLLSDDNTNPTSQSSQKPEGQNFYPHQIPQNESPSDGSEYNTQKRGPTRPPDYAPKPSYDPNYNPNRRQEYYANKYPEDQRPKEEVYIPKNQVEPPLETETVSPGLEEETRYDNEDPDMGSDESIPSQSAQPAEEPVEILEDDPEELQYAQLDLLEDRAIELQAISYSKTPEQRIAVINNEIIHQGRSVGGYKVIYIGPEQVVVEKGGNQWKIIFMVR